MREYLGEIAVYKYILKCLYDEILKRSGQCDACDDLLQIKLHLTRLCKANEIDLDIDRD